jgi:hypothetical protein
MKKPRVAARCAIAGLAVVSAWAVRVSALGATRAVDASTPAGWTATKTTDNQPDIQGYWNQRNNVTTYSLERGDEDRRGHNRITGQRAATGKPIVDPADGKIPFQPWAAKKYQFLLSVHTGPERVEDLDPVARGFMEGTPRINLQTGFQILQPAGYVVFLYEYGHHYRIVPLDDRPHAPENVKLWMGDSRGHWEGQTLVIDVTNNNEQTWFDQVGAFHSAALHVVEHWTFAGPDALDYRAVIEDPAVFTRPWTIGMNYGRNKEKGYEQMESAVWEGNRAVEFMVHPKGTPGAPGSKTNVPRR